MKRTAVSAAVLCLGALSLAASDQESVDWGMMTRIRDEGFSDSKVMQTLQMLTDVHGPRLTGSPNARRAADWARQELENFGLQNPHLESWGPFGRGWSFDRSSVVMIAPNSAVLTAYPKAWTPGTDGLVKGKVVKAQIESEEDVEKWKGKLGGAIVLLGEARELRAPDKSAFSRYDEKGLDELSLFEIPSRRAAGAPAGAPAAASPPQSPPD
jgi:hypothetical protein